MRLSTVKGDRGYARCSELLAQGKHIGVLLDGVEQRLVETADEEQGVVVRCVFDGNGDIQINPDKPNEVWYETVCGKVEIKIS